MDDNYIAILVVDKPGRFDEMMINVAQTWLRQQIGKMDRPGISALAKKIGVPRNRLTRVLRLLGLHGLAKGGA